MKQISKACEPFNTVEVIVDNFFECHTALAAYDFVLQQTNHKNVTYRSFIQNAVAANNLAKEPVLWPLGNTKYLNMINSCPKISPLPDLGDVCSGVTCSDNNLMQQCSKIKEKYMDTLNSVNCMHDAVFVSFGRSNLQDIQKLRKRVQWAVQHVKARRLIFACGGNLVLQSYLKNFSNANIEAYLECDCRTYLKQTSLCICHGGLNSVVEALDSGQFVVVLAFDDGTVNEIERAENGRILQGLGVGKLVLL
eukprot:CAMPEP_0183795234 /NCGR_PEP_ID=MMETSP0803_2-20130417/4303_1 /TAXON_ID=195967 /ORGANISM="Crustomastix stigmata, Strain CCMP3273" /LENGTH=250 /DNA_ID=CAMNT_0026039645 /DNA_START=481 /DNA_END=1236 /DNA_ORIENTATION=-